MLEYQKQPIKVKLKMTYNNTVVNQCIIAFLVDESYSRKEIGQIKKKIVPGSAAFHTDHDKKPN